MESFKLNLHGRCLIPLVLLYSLTFFQQSFSQFISEKVLAKAENDLARTETALKYIYSFPVIRTDVRMNTTGQKVDIPVYDNEALTGPVMKQVLAGKIPVYDPNFWGDVYDIRNLTTANLTDTSQILKYMDAGRDSALIIDESGNISWLEQYTQPDFDEISGIFFMEKWLLNARLKVFYKDIIAYLPIRDYYESDEDLNLHKKRRLLFMVVPPETFSEDSRKDKTRKTGDYELIYRDLSCEMNLYNKPYSDYLYRNELDNKISQDEYEEWEYHHFDFFRHFDRDYFIQQLISSVQRGELKAYRPDDPSTILTANEVEQLSLTPRTEINSVIFHEDWYLSRKDLDLEKVVRDLVLVRHVNEYDSYTGELIRVRKDPLAVIRFNL